MTTTYRLTVTLRKYLIQASASSPSTRLRLGGSVPRMCRCASLAKSTLPCSKLSLFNKLTPDLAPSVQELLIGMRMLNGYSYWPAFRVKPVVDVACSIFFDGNTVWTTYKSFISMCRQSACGSSSSIKVYSVNLHFGALVPSLISSLLLRLGRARWFDARARDALHLYRDSRDGFLVRKVKDDLRQAKSAGETLVPVQWEEHKYLPCRSHSLGR